MIRFNQVSKKLKNGEILFNSIDFHVSQGSMVLFKGGTGTGKTTLIKLMLGLDSFDKGAIEVNRTYIKHLKEPARSCFRRQFGIVCQGVKLLEKHNVFYNVALPLIIARYTPKEVKARVFAALEKVDLHDKCLVLPKELSVEELKAVSIARAIINKPKILLVDDLFSNLDKKKLEQFLALLKLFNDVGITTVLTAKEMELPITGKIKTFLITDKKIQLIT